MLRAWPAVRKVRRRMPPDDGPVSLGAEAREQLEAEVRSLGQVVQAACALQRAVAARTEHEPLPPLDKLKELAHEATDRVYGKEDQVRRHTSSSRGGCVSALWLPVLFRPAEHNLWPAFLCLL